MAPTRREMMRRVSWRRHVREVMEAARKTEPHLWEWEQWPLLISLGPGFRLPPLGFLGWKLPILRPRLARRRIPPVSGPKNRGGLVT